MATTGIWKVEKRLDHVLDYVMNPEKTTTDNQENIENTETNEPKDIGNKIVENTTVTNETISK